MFQQPRLTRTGNFSVPPSIAVVLPTRECVDAVHLADAIIEAHEREIRKIQGLIAAILIERTSVTAPGFKPRLP